jgi:superfamily II DNA or RNA helicase
VKESEVIITSYALLRRDEEFLATLDLTYAILDEAQHIKNPQSATAAAAKRLRSKKRLALTGTPIENRRDLEYLTCLARPVRPTRRFEQRFAKLHRRRRLRAAQRLPRHDPPPSSFGHARSPRPREAETDQIRDSSAAEARLLRSCARSAQVLGEVEKNGIGKSQIQILAGLTRLRQAACDPRLLGLPKDFTNDDSGKLVALRELLANAIEGGHKVLVFSQFVQMLKLVEKAVKEDGITYEYLDGSTKDRAERVERFQTDPGVGIFLISFRPAALEPTAADIVIHSTLRNPPSSAIRPARISSVESVVSVLIVAAGRSREDPVPKEKKRELFQRAPKTRGPKKLTKQDLEDLFSLE